MYLYVMRCRNYFKIGISHNVIRRREVLQIGNPYDIHILGQRAFHTKDAAFAAEQALHRTFRRYKKRGEWFKGASHIQKLFTEQSINPNLDLAQCLVAK